MEEITKEIKTGLIKKQSDFQYESLIKKYLETGGQNHQTLLKELQSAKKTIEDWSKSKDDRSKIKTLTQQQRQSLRKFYELYRELSDHKNKFSKELIEVSENSVDIPQNQPKDQIPSTQTVTSFLRAMAWDNEKTRMSFSEIKRNKWGDWNNKSNPFKVFYQYEEEFKKDLSNARDKEEEVNRLLQQSRSEQGNWGSWVARSAPRHFETQQRQLAGEKDSSSGIFQLRVGSKLLEWMGQLNK